MWEIITTHKIRARYNDVSYHGVRKWLTNLPTTNRTFISSGTDTGSLTWISLCHSGFKGLAVSSVRGIVTFNIAGVIVWILHEHWHFSPTRPVLQSFLIKGGKYMEIHGNSWNSSKFGQFTEFFMSNTCSRYPSYPSQGYPSNANLHKETKEVWTLQPKPSQLEEQCRLGATVQPYPVIT